MKRAGSITEKNSFLHLNRIKIQQPQKEEIATRRPNLKVIEKITETPEVDPSPLPEPSNAKEINSTNVDLNVKTPEDYFINALTNQAEIRKLFNIEEVGAEETPQMQLGTYENLLKQAGAQGIAPESIDRGFDIEAAQHYALLQIYLKTVDAHGENILISIDQNHHLLPTPLNYRHCLSEDPNNETMLPRTTRWEKWPALNLPISPPIIDYVMNNDPDTLVERIKLDFLNQCGSELSQDQKEIFDKRFKHLKYNMIMVKEAVSEGLKIKQILALILPAIDDFAFKFVTQGVLKGGELWPARKRYASLHTAFRTAWNKAKKNPEASTNIFREQIRMEIDAIKKLSPEALETNYFQSMSYELRKGLYL